MSQKLYIGNLPFRTTEADIRKYFSKFEPIVSIVLISDRETGRARGFGFIELEDDRVESAIQELGDTMFCGRNLRISRAKDRTDNSQPLLRMPQMATA